MKLNLNLVSSLYSQRTNSASGEKKSLKNQYSTNVLAQDTVSFTGLTRQMNKHTYIDGQKDIKEIVKKHEGRSLIVGQLPDFIMAKLPKENRREAIQEFYDTFDQISKELREFDETKVYTIDEITKRRNNSTKELLENLLRKYKLVSPWDDVDIEYLGKGGKGSGYKLVGLRNPSMNEDEYVLKNYHVVEGKNWQPYKSHGCYAEMNSAAYWMNNVGYETQRGKFFFGNLKTGYMVIKYVDDDVRLPKYKVDPYWYGLKCTDEDLIKKHNVCKDYSFDWGGVRVVNRIKNGSKTARMVAAKIKNTPDERKPHEWERFFASKKMDKSQKNAGLAMSIKHMPDKEYYIERCMALHDPLVDRGLAYVLKYLPYEEAVKYFERLVQTNDVITQVVLFNEIPLLAMKHRDDNIKDDLQTVRSEIMPTRVLKYYDIAEQYAMPESIEHLASFLHLLPKDQFRPYYRRLAKIDNEALQDRLIYKLSNVSQEDKFFAVKNIAENLKNIDLKKRLLFESSFLPQDKLEKLEEILGLDYKEVKKEMEM